jgi:flagellin-like protein
MRPTTALDSEDGDRAQVGIGTLIVFIALVLVAAVAAGVLIQTSGLLEERASDTGEEAQASVSNQIDVVGATGNVSTSSGTVDTVNLTVKKSAGSDAIDLTDATIQYTSDTEAVTLTYNDSTADAGNFTTSSLQGETASILSDTGQRIQVQINTSDIETDTSGLAPGDDAELELVSQGGATTVYGVNVPDVLVDKEKTPV